MRDYKVINVIQCNLQKNGMEMITKGKKTVMRTIRLTKEDIDDLLREDAQAKGLSPSSLLNQVLKKYVDWDRNTERFGFVCLARETFQAILELVDDKKLEDTAIVLGGIMPKQAAMFWFKKLNLETLLQTLSLVGRYGGQFAVETEIRERNYVITFRHQLGGKWSIWLRNVMSQFVKSATGVLPDTEATGNMVVVRFLVS